MYSKYVSFWYKIISWDSWIFTLSILVIHLKWDVWIAATPWACGPRWAVWRHAAPGRAAGPCAHRKLLMTTGFLHIFNFHLSFSVHIQAQPFSRSRTACHLQLDPIFPRPSPQLSSFIRANVKRLSYTKAGSVGIFSTSRHVGFW